MANDKSNQADAAKRGTDPGVTAWADGSRTDADVETGDLTTETGDQLRKETGQSGSLEEVRPGP